MDKCYEKTIGGRFASRWITDAVGAAYTESDDRGERMRQVRIIGDHYFDPFVRKDKITYFMDYVVALEKPGVLR